MDQSGPKEDWKFHPRITWNWSYFPSWGNADLQ